MTGREDRVAGVVGFPVAHSMSPVIFSHWFERYDIAGTYRLLPTPPEALARFVQSMPAENYVGVNVTIPHKVSASKLADRSSTTAQRIGAANVLTVNVDGSIDADNTDGYGFMHAMRAQAPDWHAGGSSAVVLGAGGAARAVVDALVQANVPAVHVLNRTLANAQALADALPGPITAVPKTQWNDALAEASVVVNTTNLGMRGHPPLELPLALIRPAAVIVDIVYTPLETPLLVAARGAGHNVVDGLGMLLYQAVPAFEKWFGIRPAVTAELRAKIVTRLST